MAAAQGRYLTNNQFGSLMANDKISKDRTAETIAGTIVGTTITSHMVHLSAQTAVFLGTNASQINASLKQLAANNNQLNQQPQMMMQQMAMLTTNQRTTATARTRNTIGSTPNNYLGRTIPNPIYAAHPSINIHHHTSHSINNLSSNNTCGQAADVAEAATEAKHNVAEEPTAERGLRCQCHTLEGTK